MVASTTAVAAAAVPSQSPRVFRGAMVRRVAVAAVLRSAGSRVAARSEWDGWHQARLLSTISASSATTSTNAIGDGTGPVVDATRTAGFTEGSATPLPDQDDEADPGNDQRDRSAADDGGNGRSARQDLGRRPQASRGVGSARPLTRGGKGLRGTRGRETYSEDFVAGRVTMTRYVDILRTRAEEGRIDRALRVFEELLVDGKQPNRAVYHALVTGILRAVRERPEHVAELPRLFELMRSGGLLPDIKLVNTALLAMVRAGRVGSAFALFDAARLDGVRPTGWTFHILVEASIAAGDLDRATELMDMMRGDGVSPDGKTYAVVIRACADRGLSDRAMELFQVCVCVCGCVWVDVRVFGVLPCVPD